MAPAFALANIPITKVDVFVERPLAVKGIPNTDITIFDLSRKDVVQATAPRFPPNPEIAQAMAKQWLESPEGQTYIADLKAAYTGHAKMIEYGVLKLPAIVFDNGKFVIYGTTDLMLAVRDYDHFMQSYKPENKSSASDSQ